TRSRSVPFLLCALSALCGESLFSVASFAPVAVKQFSNPCHQCYQWWVFFWFFPALSAPSAVKTLVSSLENATREPRRSFTRESPAPLGAAGVSPGAFRGALCALKDKPWVSGRQANSVPPQAGAKPNGGATNKTIFMLVWNLGSGRLCGWFWPYSPPRNAGQRFSTLELPSFHFTSSGDTLSRFSISMSKKNSVWSSKRTET